MNNITAKELKAWIDSNKDFQLLDVREPFEHEAFNIGGILAPLGEITQQMDRIEKEKPVVLYCHRGIRSQIAIQRLQDKYPFQNLINLTGGMVAWKEQFEQDGL